MAMPLPAPGMERLGPPARDEAQACLDAVITAIAPPGGPTDLQRALTEAAFAALTGHDLAPTAACSPEQLGAVLAGDRPTLVRQYPGFLSQADAVSIMAACLDAPRSLRYEIFDAMSENRGRWRDTEPAKRLLGWRPEGSSDAFDPAALGEPRLARDPRWPPLG